MPDNEALLAARDGDASAAQRLVAAHGASMLKTAWRILGRYGHRDAEDVVQEAFIAAWTTDALPTGDVGAWLRAIAARKALDHGRRRQRLSEESLELREAPIEAELDDVGTQGAETAASDVLTVRRALQELSTTDRAVLTLVDLEGRSTAETATELGLTRAAVKLRAMRARRKLASWLKADGRTGDNG